MSWSGWFALDGNEILNVARVEAYTRAAHLSWAPHAYQADQLAPALGDGSRYTTPLQDLAPWIDDDDPASWEFLGLYPIDVTGVEDSTRTSQVVEYTVDGGAPGRLRHTTKSVVFNALLCASSPAGAEYGMQWLKEVLLGSPCAGQSPMSSPFGADLCYFATEPAVADLEPATLIPAGWSAGSEWDDGVGWGAEGVVVPSRSENAELEECASALRRTLRKFAVVSGPAVITKFEPTEGALWQVQFTGVAGIPWEFGEALDVVSGFLTDSMVLADGSTADPDGFTFADSDCVEPEWGPVNDPNCPAFVAPPAPPTVPLGCVTVPSTWTRRQFTIPATLVPSWTEVVPVIEVTTGEDELRNLRVRFYADPFDENDADKDPCAYCGDILISYAPANSIMTVDAASQTVYCDMPGGVRRRADALVFGADGAPFDWPSLSCGFSYIVTVDLPLNPDPTASVDLSLVPRSR